MKVFPPPWAPAGPRNRELGRREPDSADDTIPDLDSDGNLYKYSDSESTSSSNSPPNSPSKSDNPSEASTIMDLNPRGWSVGRRSKANELAKQPLRGAITRAAKRGENSVNTTRESPEKKYRAVDKDVLYHDGEQNKVKAVGERIHKWGSETQLQSLGSSGLGGASLQQQRANLTFARPPISTSPESSAAEATARELGSMTKSAITSAGLVKSTLSLGGIAAGGVQEQIKRKLIVR